MLKNELLLLVECKFFSFVGCPAILSSSSISSLTEVSRLSCLLLRFTRLPASCSGLLFLLLRFFELILLLLRFTRLFSSSLALASSFEIFRSWLASSMIFDELCSSILFGELCCVFYAFIESSLDFPRCFLRTWLPRRFLRKSICFFNDFFLCESTCFNPLVWFNWRLWLIYQKEC